MIANGIKNVAMNDTYHIISQTLITKTLVLHTYIDIVLCFIEIKKQ